MMKKLLAVALLAGTAGVAMADDNTGCGLGTMIWAGQSGPIFKSFAVTTNGTSGNQTFGITTGTLGCDSNGAITSKRVTYDFARQMQGATEIKCSQFGDNIIEHM